MKHIFPLILAVCLLFSGCQVKTANETAEFYYVQAAYQTDLGNPIAAEWKEITGHSGDLAYLVQLYLVGPSQDTLVSPFPRSCQFLSASKTDYGIQIKLSDTELTMTDAAFTLGCACLTLTFLGIAQVQAVTVISGNRKVTMDRSTLTLYDSGVPAATEETQ